MQNTPWSIKNVALYFCPYLCQLLTDFQNSSTGTLCGQFSLMRLLYIPPHHNCVFCVLVKHKCEQRINNNNEHLGKWKKPVRLTMQ